MTYCLCLRDVLLGLIIGFIVCSASANAIYGGKPVEKGLDAIGKVTTKECPDPEYYCTGTLIQGNVVLTVAHFFEGICASPNEKTNANFTVNGHSFSGEVERYKPYVKGSGDPNNDIALIILNQNVSKELGIKPIPIANNGESKDRKIVVGIGPISKDCKKSSLGKKYKCTLCTKNDGIETITLKPCKKEKIAGICPGDSGCPALDMNNQIVAIATEDLRIYNRGPPKKSVGNVFTEINKDNEKNKKKYNWIQCVMKNAREMRKIEC